MPQEINGGIFGSAVASQQQSLSKVSVKAVAFQLALMTSISVSNATNPPSVTALTLLGSSSQSSHSHSSDRERKRSTPLKCAAPLPHVGVSAHILQLKFQLPRPDNPLDDLDYEPPPPALSNGFFAWFSPVVHMKEEQLIQNIGEWRCRLPLPSQ